MGSEQSLKQQQSNNNDSLNMRQFFIQLDHIQNNTAYGQGIIYQLKKTQFNSTIIQSNSLNNLNYPKQLSNFKHKQKYILREETIPINQQQKYKRFFNSYINIQKQIPTVTKLCKNWFKIQKSGCYSFLKGLFIFQYYQQNLLSQLKSRKILNQHFTQLQLTSLADCILSGAMLLERTGLSLKCIYPSDITFNLENQIYTICIVRSLFQSKIQNLFTVIDKENYQDVKQNQRKCIQNIGQILQSCLNLSITKNDGQINQKFKGKYSNELLQMIKKCKDSACDNFMSLYQILSPIQKKAIGQSKVSIAQQTEKKKQFKTDTQKADTISSRARKIIDGMRKMSLDKLSSKSPKSNFSSNFNTAKRGCNYDNGSTKQNRLVSNSRGKHKLVERFKVNQIKIDDLKGFYKNNKSNCNDKTYIPIDEYCQNMKKKRQLELLKQLYNPDELKSGKKSNKIIESQRFDDYTYRCKAFDYS